jgi:hypothetical protein
MRRLLEKRSLVMLSKEECSRSAFAPASEWSSIRIVSVAGWSVTTTAERSTWKSWRGGRGGAVEGGGEGRAA